MAVANRAARSISNGVSQTVKRRYACRVCRHQFQQPIVQQIRPASSVSLRKHDFPNSSTSKNQTRSISLNPFGRSSPPKEAASPSELEDEDMENHVEMEEYIEAENWDGLEHMGHLGSWKDLPPKSMDSYTPWLDSTQTTPLSRDDTLALLHSTVIKSLAYKALQRNSKKAVKPGRLRGIDLSSSKIQTSSSGTIQGLEDPATLLQPPKAIQRKRSTLSASDLEAQLSGIKFDFRSLTTFKILKIFSQLIGRRIPDPVLNAVMRGDKDLVEFVDLLVQATKPKPKKFATVLLEKQREALDSAARTKSEADPERQTDADKTTRLVDAALADSENTKQRKQKKVYQPLGPNVMILPRRETTVDREMEIGRWKVIKKELESRGLPVYAHPVLAPGGKEPRAGEFKDT